MFFKKECMMKVGANVDAQTYGLLIGMLERMGDFEGCYAYVSNY